MITRSHLRDEISNAIGDLPHDQRQLVVDAIEQRLAEERIFRPMPDGRLELGYKKRVGLGHIFVALITLVYLFNPGFGMLELIPDNLPLVGNLDEGLLVALVSNWIFMAWWKDRQERRGESADTSPGATLHGSFGRLPSHTAISSSASNPKQLEAPVATPKSSASASSTSGSDENAEIS